MGDGSDRAQRSGRVGDRAVESVDDILARHGLLGSTPPSGGRAQRRRDEAGRGDRTEPRDDGAPLAGGPSRPPSPPDVPGTGTTAPRDHQGGGSATPPPGRRTADDAPTTWFAPATGPGPDPRQQFAAPPRPTGSRERRAVHEPMHAPPLASNTLTATPPGMPVTPSGRPRPALPTGDRSDTGVSGRPVGSASRPETEQPSWAAAGLPLSLIHI